MIKMDASVNEILEQVRNENLSPIEGDRLIRKLEGIHPRFIAQGRMVALCMSDDPEDWKLAFVSVVFETLVHDLDNLPDDHVARLKSWCYGAGMMERLLVGAMQSHVDTVAEWAWDWLRLWSIHDICADAEWQIPHTAKQRGVSDTLVYMDYLRGEVQTKYMLLRLDFEAEREMQRRKMEKAKSKKQTHKDGTHNG